MPKKLLKEFMFTSIALTLVVALFIEELRAGNNSIITNAMVQTEWCAVGDYICILKYYFFFSMAFLLIGFIIDLGIKAVKKKKKPVVKKEKKEPQILVLTNGQMGGQAIGNVFGNVVYQQPPQKTIDFSPAFNQIDFSIDQVQIIPNTQKLDQTGNQVEFKFTLINNTNNDLHDCVVYLEEIAFQKRESKQWIIKSGLISVETLKWELRFRDIHGRIKIENGDRQSFYLMGATNISYDTPRYIYSFIFHKSTHKFKIEKNSDCRVLISFHGKNILGKELVRKKFHIFLKETSEGILGFDAIELA